MSGVDVGQVASLAGRDLGSRSCSYDERDAILYALAVGAHASELELVYERRLDVLPFYALPLGLWAVGECGSVGAYDAALTLHVGQELVLHAPLPRQATFEAHAEVEAVWDKGSAALVDIGVHCDLFDARYTIFVPGGGGFGGERGSRPAADERTGPPDVRTAFSTTSDQAALYRLTGDRHPVHVDPEAAAAAGFDRPILHGLCTLGGVALALARATGHHPTEVDRLEARLSSPVLPGDDIAIQGWSSGGACAFVATAADGAAAVTSGRVSFGRS